MTTDVGSIGIAGFGFVGQAVCGALKDMRSVGAVYDKYKQMDTIEALFNTPIIFCCLPTKRLEDGSQDFSEYIELLDVCIRNKYEGILVIKSTVLYSNIEPYLSRLKIVMNPEFLCQNDAVNDFMKQSAVILGGRVDLARAVQDAYTKHFTLYTPEYVYCTAKEAVDIKYTHNIYHAYKVLFWNYVQETTGNARKMAALYHKVADRNEMTAVCADGRKGYGGACFPKDVSAYNTENPDELTEFMKAYNTRLRGEDA